MAHMGNNVISSCGLMGKPIISHCRQLYSLITPDVSTFCHFPTEMKSGTFAQILNPNPFEISSYRNNSLHSCQAFLLRAPVFSVPPWVHTHSSTSTAAASSPCSAHGMFFDILSLAATFVGSLEHSGQSQRSALPFCNFGDFFSF